MMQAVNARAHSNWLKVADEASPRAETTWSNDLPKISVVIPTLNERDNLPHVLPHIPEWVHEVLLVDGKSTDGTLEHARQLWPNIHIVSEDRRGKGSELKYLGADRRGKGITLKLVTQVGRGKGAALRSGFATATGDIIITLDGDGSTDPLEIPRFVNILLSGADFAKGSRFLNGGGTADMPLYRKLGNWSFVMIVRLLFGGRYTDLCYGYNAFWARVLPMLNLDDCGFEIETMMNVRALRAGLRVVEVPSFESKRVYGEGRLKTIPDGWRVLMTIFRERFETRHTVPPIYYPIAEEERAG